MQNKSDVLYMSQGDNHISPECHRRLVLVEAGEIVNSLIHSEIAKLKSEPLPGDIKQLDINNMIEDIDPVLWSFLENATRTVRERKSKSNEEKNQHVKKLRCFYRLCVLVLHQLTKANCITHPPG